MRGPFWVRPCVLFAEQRFYSDYVFFHSNGVGVKGSDAGFGIQFLFSGLLFRWRAASLDFIAAIAHCVPTNTDAMVFIMGKPT